MVADPFAETVLHSQTDRLQTFWKKLQRRAFSVLSSGNPFIACQYFTVRGLRTLNGKQVQQRLGQLSTWLGERDYLEDRFTAGDLMMTTVLRNLRHTQLVEAQPNLKAYQTRCEARPAFQRAAMSP